MHSNHESIQKDGTLTVPSSDLHFNGTICEFFDDRCKKYENSVSSIDTISGETFTFAEFDKLSQSVASALYKKGLRKGDVVLYMCYDLVKLHIFFNGVWRANGVLRGLYAEELEDSITSTMAEVNSKWILCEDTEAEKCLSVAHKLMAGDNDGKRIEVIVMQRNISGCTSIYDLFQDDGKECPKSEINNDDVALILSTSGTTGRPKGAVHSHKSIIRCMESCELNTNFGKRNLFLSKGAHITGAVLPLVSFSIGATLLTVSRITVENIFHAVEKYKPDHIWGFPTFLLAIAYDERMAKVDKRSIKYILTGGTSIPPTLKSELQQQMTNLKTVSIVYGLTESAPSIMSSYRPNSESDVVNFELPVGSMGKIVTGASLKIIDENGKALGPNQQGEMCFKNECMISGYYKQEKETEDAFTDDGWFRSGDTGYYDEQGFVYYLGRRKEMFKCGGNHVFPATIDEVINKHPDIQEVCTIGIDDPAGEKMPRAFVVLKPGSNATADEIKQFAHKNLPSYKHLRGGLYIMASLPKGITGKTARLLVEKLSVPE